MSLEGITKAEPLRYSVSLDHEISDQSCDDKKTLIVNLSDVRYCVHKKSLLTLINHSNLIQEIFSKSVQGEINLPKITLQHLKKVLSFLSTGSLFEKDIFLICESLAALKCEEKINSLCDFILKEMNSYSLSEENLLNCLHGYFWAKSWGIEAIEISSRRFIQRFLQKNINDSVRLKSITSTFESLSSMIIPLTLQFKTRLTKTFFTNLMVFTDHLVGLDLRSIPEYLEEPEIEKIGCLIKLTSLAANIKVGREGIRSINRLTDLSSLEISLLPQEPETFSELNLPNLTALSLSSTNVHSSEINDYDLLSLHKFIKLSILKLNNCSKLTQKGISALREKKVTRLSLGGRAERMRLLPEKELQEIACLPLTFLSLKCTLINEISLEVLQLEGLTHLNLSKCIKITDLSLEVLKIFPNLETLKLNNCKIEGYGLNYLSSLKELKTLSLKNSNLVGRFLKELQPLCKLSSINLENCSYVGNNGLEALGLMAGLTHLNILGCNKVTDEGLKHLAKSKTLLSIDLPSSISEIGRV